MKRIFAYTKVFLLIIGSILCLQACKTIPVTKPNAFPNILDTMPRIEQLQKLVNDEVNIQANHFSKQQNKSKKNARRRG
jgi:hypothetical protein